MAVALEDALQAAITSFVDDHNAHPKPFRWTKTADDILASIERSCLRISLASRLPGTKQTMTDPPFFEGTGYHIGDAIGDVVGYEWDNRDPDGDGNRL